MTAFDQGPGALEAAMSLYSLTGFLTSKVLGVD